MERIKNNDDSKLHKKQTKSNLPTDGKTISEQLEGYLQSSLYEKAISTAKSSLQSDGVNVDVAILGSRAARQAGDFEQSYHFLKAALDYEPKNRKVANEFKQLHAAIEEASGDDAIEEKSYNALQFCSQEYYPGDDELFCNERQILELKYKIETKPQILNPVEAQRAKRAAREAIVAHGLMSTNNLSDAIYHCTCAIDFDPTNVAIRQLRADMMEMNGDVTGALGDLYMIPKPKRSASVWKHGGNETSVLGVFTVCVTCILIKFCMYSITCSNIMILFFLACDNDLG